MPSKFKIFKVGRINLEGTKRNLLMSRVIIPKEIEGAWRLSFKESTSDFFLPLWCLFKNLAAVIRSGRLCEIPFAS